MGALSLGSHGNGATSGASRAGSGESFRSTLVDEENINFKNATQLIANRTAGRVSCINDDSVAEAVLSLTSLPLLPHSPLCYSKVATTPAVERVKPFRIHVCSITVCIFVLILLYLCIYTPFVPKKFRAIPSA
jgi:hypothetical protein